MPGRRLDREDKIISDRIVIPLSFLRRASEEESVARLDISVRARI